MAQEHQLEATNTFIKGLITEAGELTFPKDASVDELNCDLKKDGSRSRRLGIKLEPDAQESTETAGDYAIITVHDWKNVGNRSGLEYVVVQLGKRLVFYRKSGTTFSANSVEDSGSGAEYVINLTDYARPEAEDIHQARVSVSSINGILVVVGPEINSFYVKRDTDGSFSEHEINFKIRDYEWQVDNTDNLTSESSGASVGVARQYDTANTGWVDTKGALALDDYIADRSAYPPLTIPWYSGKDSNGNFDTSTWRKLYAGNTLGVNGHFKVNLYEVDRNDVSKFSGLEVETEEARFSAVASYSGRVFFSGMNKSTNNNSSKVFFSQVLSSNYKNIGDLHQINDPTSEVLSDLLDTDGGYINIPDAYNIKQLHVFGAVLYVFADNGVWSVSGIDDVFRATSYSVAKISEDGLSQQGSFVSANGRPYWWSDTGIHTLGVQDSVVISSNISLTTIQTYWQDITNNQKVDVEVVYDVTNNKVIWMWPDDGEELGRKANNFLVFDEALQAFYPWRIDDPEDSDYYVCGATFWEGTGEEYVSNQVVTSSNDDIVDSNGDEVIVTSDTRIQYPTIVKFLVRNGNTGSVTFAELSDTTFLDWGSVDYTSFAEAGYNFMGDMSRAKNAPHITVYMRTTETGWELNESGGYDPVRPSSLYLTAYWDFRYKATTNPQQVYRLKPAPIVSGTTWDYPKSVVKTRLKVRGRGRVIKLRWESETGKDFHLLGYEVHGATNPGF